MKNNFSDCKFCTLTPSETFTIFETETVNCILDKKPLVDGHCLLIPKVHFETIFDADEAMLTDITLAMQRCSKLLVSKLGATGVNILHASGTDAQQSVNHFHVHIIPRFENDEVNLWPNSTHATKELDETFQKFKD